MSKLLGFHRHRQSVTGLGRGGTKVTRSFLGVMTQASSSLRAEVQSLQHGLSKKC